MNPFIQRARHLASAKAGNAGGYYTQEDYIAELEHMIIGLNEVATKNVQGACGLAFDLGRENEELREAKDYWIRLYNRHFNAKVPPSRSGTRLRVK